jgi:replicative superfamily II helicase
LLTLAGAPTEIGIEAYVCRGGMLRSDLETDSLAAFYAEREGLTRSEIAEVRDAVLVVMDPIHCLFGDRKPWLESIPEHIAHPWFANTGLPSQ